jgi:outer membrane immunogenic protein
MVHRFSAVLIGGIAAVVLTQMASAADLPRKAPAYTPPPPPVYIWTGIYVGGNVGGAFSNTDWTFFNGINSEAFSQDTSSWIAGGQVGYLHQFSPNWVAGVEVSWSGTRLKETSLSALTADRSRESKITDLLLVTARLGYASNNWLGYIKGGYANANVEFNTWVTSTGQTTTTSSDREGGWTVGAGIEYAFTPNITAGFEYNFARIGIGDRNQDVTPGFLTPETVSSAHADIHTVWARLNFKFAPFR